MSPEPLEALDAYFDLFQTTLTLAQKLTEEQTNAQEILILLCARLDALASDSAREDKPRMLAFVQFVTAYGQRSVLRKISVGDLFYELAYHRWVLPGTIETAGRLRRFSRVDDPTISLLIESGIPLTQRDANRLLTSVMLALRKNYKIAPGQSERKAYSATREDLVTTILGSFDTPRRHHLIEKLPAALDDLLAAKKMAAILYESFRSEAIHGAMVQLDEKRFFSRTEPYWVTKRSDQYGPYLTVEFPATFLADLLRKCIKTYKQHLIAKAKLPPGVFFHVFGHDSLAFLEFLDQDTLPQSRVLRPS